DRPGQHEEPAGDERARGPAEAPADIGCELLRLGTRQQHAEGQHVLKAFVVEPAALLDIDAVHQGDLPGRAAKAQAAELQGITEKRSQRWRFGHGLPHGASCDAWAKRLTGRSRVPMRKSLARIADGGNRRLARLVLAAIDDLAARNAGLDLRSEVALVERPFARRAPPEHGG